MQNGCQIRCDSCDGNTRGPVPKFIFADGEPPEDWDVWGAPGLVPDPRYPQPNHFGNSTPVSPGGSGQTICPSRKPKATICEPALRTININAPCGSSSDYYYYSPWRAPGSAPVLDPWCVACRVESQPAMQSTASRESAYLRAVSLSLSLCVPVSLSLCVPCTRSPQRRGRWAQTWPRQRRGRRSLCQHLSRAPRRSRLDAPGSAVRHGVESRERGRGGLHDERISWRRLLIQVSLTARVPLDGIVYLNLHVHAQAVSAGERESRRGLLPAVPVAVRRAVQPALGRSRWRGGQCRLLLHIMAWPLSICESRACVTISCTNGMSAPSVGLFHGWFIVQLFFNATRVSEGTTPPGSEWAKHPVPRGPWGWSRTGASHPPVCKESEECMQLGRRLSKAACQKDPHNPRCRAIPRATANTTKGCRCSDDGAPSGPANLEVVDRLSIPSGLAAGQWLLGWRWDSGRRIQVCQVLVTPHGEDVSLADSDLDCCCLLRVVLQRSRIRCGVVAVSQLISQCIAPCIMSMMSMMSMMSCWSHQIGRC